MLVGFHEIAPQLAAEEGRSLTVPEGSALPAGDYMLIELYCPDVECDCQRVFLRVHAGQGGEAVATVSHAFERGVVDPAFGRTFLEPLQPQGPEAGLWLELLEDMLTRDAAFHRRLERHYALVKVAAADPEHPCQALLADDGPIRRLHLPPGSVGTQRDPAVLRVPYDEVLATLTSDLDAAGVNYIAKLRPNQESDLSDLRLIGQMRPPPVQLSRQERRALAKKQRRRRRR